MKRDLNSCFTGKCVWCRFYKSWSGSWNGVVRVQINGNLASTTHIASARAEQFQAKADSLLSWPAVSAQPFTCVSLFNLKQKASLNRASDWQRVRRKALPFEMACIDEMQMKWAHLFSLKWKEGGGSSRTEGQKYYGNIWWEIYHKQGTTSMINRRRWRKGGFNNKEYCIHWKACVVASYDSFTREG